MRSAPPGLTVVVRELVLRWFGRYQPSLGPRYSAELAIPLSSRVSLSSAE